MYAVIRRYTVRPGGARELAARVENEFVPMLKTMPEFLSYTYLEGGQEGGRDVLATFGLFMNRDAAEESMRRATKWARDSLGDFDLSQPSVTAGEVMYMIR